MGVLRDSGAVAVEFVDGVIVCGDIVESVGDLSWPSCSFRGLAKSVLPKACDTISLTLPLGAGSPGAGGSLFALPAVRAVCELPARRGTTWLKCSFSFFRYRSLSLRALSKSLLSPRIIALCLSTNLHSWVFWAAEDCFSFSKYCMTASADPAALIRFAISAGLAGTESALWCVEACDDIDDTAESMDEFRGIGRGSACCDDDDGIMEEDGGETLPV